MKPTDPLLADLTLPMRFRLTPVRASVLQKFGVAWLTGAKVQTWYRYKPTWRHLQGMPNRRQWSKAEKAALLQLVNAGLVYAEPLPGQTYYDIKMRFDLRTIAERLAARQVLMQERVEQVSAATVEKLDDKLLQAKRTYAELGGVGYSNRHDIQASKTVDVLAAFDAVQSLDRQVKRAQEEYAAAKAAAEQAAAPTVDECLAWLMKRRLMLKEGV